MAPYLPTSFPTDPLPMGLPGMPYDNRELRHVDSWLSSSPQAQQTATLTVDTYTDGADYVFTLNSKVITYKALTVDADVAGVAAKIAEAINDEPLVSGSVYADPAAAVVTIEARWPGITFTLAESDAKLTAAAGTANAAALPFKYGRLVKRTGTGKAARPLAAGDIGAQVVTLGFTASNSQTYRFDIVYLGQSYPVIYAADASATQLEIATGLKAALDAYALTGITAAVNGSDQLVITGPNGVSYSVGAFSAGTGAIALVSNVAAISLNASDLAINERQDRFEPVDFNGTLIDALPANSVMAAGRVGTWVVETEEACAPGDPVYVRAVADGALTEIGVFAKTPGAGKAPVPGARWYVAGDSTRAALELFRV